MDHAPARGGGRPPTLAAATAGLPLAGRRLAVKDNIDVAGLPTTAGCPAFAYDPEPQRPGRRPPGRRRGRRSSARPNLDQFATGLVGTRTPYGAGREPGRPRPRQRRARRAVRRSRWPPGEVDARPRHRHGRLRAGARRALRGRRAQADAGLAVDAGRRPGLPLPRLRVGVRPRRRAGGRARSRRRPAPTPTTRASRRRTGRGRAARASGWASPRRRVAGDAGATRRSPTAFAALDLGRSRLVAVDLDARTSRRATLLYGGAFVAERHAAFGAFVEAHPRRRRPRRRRHHPRRPARSRPPALAADLDRLAGLRRSSRRGSGSAVDARGRADRPVATPPSPRSPPIPLGTNAALGRFTNGTQPARLVRGRRAGRHRRRRTAVRGQPCWGRRGPTGACGRPRPRSPATPAPDPRRTGPTWPLAVCGAHLEGQPLHHQLTGRGARLVARTATAPRYRMHALATDPPKPGVVRVPPRPGAPRWRSRCGPSTPPGSATFVAEVPPPLAIGTVELADGTWAKGFLCEAHALAGTDGHHRPRRLARVAGHALAHDRGRRAGRVDDRAGPPGPPRLLDGRGAAQRADGRPLVPPRQPGRRATRRRAAGLECTATGPTLRSPSRPSCASAAPTWARPSTAGPCPAGSRSRCGAGEVLRLGRLAGGGLRTYVAVRGGLDVPVVLGQPVDLHPRRLRGPRRADARRPATCCPSAATSCPSCDPSPVAPAAWPAHRPPTGASACWRAPTPRPTSSRPTTSTPSSPPSGGCRSTAPAPACASTARGRRWARADGGEAGLHPSNIHDTGYAFGTVDFTGDTPVLLGPDGPSLGGFTCPATVVAAERWKLGQLAPGDRVRFVPVDARRAAEVGAPSRRTWAAPSGPDRRVRAHGPARSRRGRARRRNPAGDDRPGRHRPAVRRRLRARRVRARWRSTSPCGPGSTPSTPGWPTHARRARRRRHARGALAARAGRPRRLSRWTRCVELAARRATTSCPPPTDLAIDARTVHLPLSWEDPATLEAIRRYMEVVRDDAPWCPSNLEFIRRINGLGLDRRRSTGPSSTPATWCSVSATCTSAHRSPRRSTPATAWSPRSTTRPARGRRRTRSASAAPTCASTAWRARAATSSSGGRCPVWYLDVAHAGRRARRAVAAAALRPDPLPPRRRPTELLDLRGRGAGGRAGRSTIEPTTFRSPSTRRSSPPRPTASPPSGPSSGRPSRPSASDWRAPRRAV